MTDHEKHENIEQAFISKLNSFAKQGYTFGNGLELRKGTIDDPNEKGTQRESFDAYADGLAAGHKHGYDEVPTGVGKTAGFLARIKCYLQAKQETASDKRVLIVVPSTDLVVQTSKAIAKFMPDLAPTIEADDDQGKEIDWENSQIGVQYGKHKHADKKPDVLITTYQSLIRDEDNTKYPPQEYGFVIYDEGHNITAPRFGEGVDKFKDSIQLAVTATPEYSDSKTVSKKLPYRYYHLSLADAIKRGDLCDVDPILIKTNFTIDEAKAKQFLESRGGQPLTKGQMEKLLNQESRNIAAIKTYLLGADQQTGERYFGQLGMVFAGGIAHTEDYCRQFESVLQKPEYKGLRDLLKEDGIAPVAYVHSKTPKAGIPLTIDGEKRNYTEDEVKELHRKGKILLLVSDGKLKLGSDFPRDSIEMDLVDRLSVVDATQRFGRGFRLDSHDPDYNHPGDPEKRCKAFNLVDENTYDLYKDTPQMLPIYAAEILEGAEFREPQKRKHLLKRFSKKIPDIDDSLEQSGFEVITNIDRVRAVSKQYKERKEQSNIKKPDDVWSSRELGAHLGMHSADHILKGLHTQYERDEKEFLTYHKIEIPRDALVTFHNPKNKKGGQLSLGIKKEWGVKIAREYASLGIPDGYYSTTDLTSILNGRDSRKILSTVRKKLEEQKESGNDQCLYRGVKISPGCIISFIDPSNGTSAWAIKNDIGDAIAGSFPQKQEKKPDIWSSSELGNAIDSKKAGANIIKKVSDYFHENVNAQSMEIYETFIPREALTQFTLRGNFVDAVHKEYGEQLAEAYLIFHEKYKKHDDLLSDKEFSALSNIGLTDARRIISDVQSAIMLGESEYMGVPISAKSTKPYYTLGRLNDGICKDTALRISEGIKNTSMQNKPADVWSSSDIKTHYPECGAFSLVDSIYELFNADKEIQETSHFGVAVKREDLITYKVVGREAKGIKQAVAKKLAIADIEQQKETIKPENVWSLMDFEEAFDSSIKGVSGIVKAIKRKFDLTNENTVNMNGVDIPRTDLVEYTYRGKQCYGIDEHSAKKLVDSYIGEQVHTSRQAPKSISPDSPHIQDRSGRSRGAAEG